jgi:hypothetical protein
MITEIVTWTNQKIENVKTSYTSKPGFLYNTSVTEIPALIGILMFLGVTKSSKESTASIWAKDGTGEPISIAAMSQKRFLFVYCLRYEDSTTRVQRRADDKLATICNTTNFSQLVKKTTLQELVAQLMNLSMDSEEGVVSSNTYQIN